jgi:hypothetical protein
MFGHAAGRQRRSLWAILSLLFALAFAWSFAVMGDQIGDSWTILRLGLALGLGISLLRLLLTFVSSRRHRRAQNERPGMEAEGQPSAEEPSTEKRPTYEEVFQVRLNVDDESLAGGPEDEEWQAEVEARAEIAEVEAEGQPSAEEHPAEERAPNAEEDLPALQPDLDGAVDQVEAIEADVESVQAIEADVESVQALEPDDDSQDSLRRMREEFAARAKEAELRVKQREAELDEAASAPKSKP